MTVASATATFVVLAAGWMVSSDLGAAELVTGEHLAMTALWVLVPLALAIAAFGSSTSIRLTLVVAAVVVAATPLVVGPRTGFAYLLLAFGAVAAASLALPVRLSSVMLFSFVGVLCLVPLGYYVLPVLVAFLSLVCTARLIAEMRKPSRWSSAGGDKSWWPFIVSAGAIIMAVALFMRLT